MSALHDLKVIHASLDARSDDRRWVRLQYLNRSSLTSESKRCDKVQVELLT